VIAVWFSWSMLKPIRWASCQLFMEKLLISTMYALEFSICLYQIIHQKSQSRYL
jgi:hypothetical protein